MEPPFIATREELHDVQMELKRVQHIQHQHSERLRQLERRQADDAALKSVWNSPFPSVLGGTPQHGPVHMSTADLLSEFEEQGETLLGALQLEADDEPMRRGAASRANSVRFDESALHGAGFGGHGIRHSNDFGPIRPSSGMGGHPMMERSYSHRSDGRHSSAGHSVHSAHSGVSGRTSSLGLDPNVFIGDHEDDSPIDFPEPAPGLNYLGSAPSIIRCWLTEEFTSEALLYAVVCTGSQKSTVEYSLLRDLDLLGEIQRDVDGVHRITLHVYLAEARVTQSNSHSGSPGGQLPNITAVFEVTGSEHQESPEHKRAIRVFVGSHTLRMHSADLLLSQNCMTLYGSDRNKLSIPFVRPEDDAVFKHLTTANTMLSRTRLNAAAPEFVAFEKKSKARFQHPTEGSSETPESTKPMTNGSQRVLSPTTKASEPNKEQAVPAVSTTSESGAESEKPTSEPAVTSTDVTTTSGKESQGAPETARREPSVAIRTAWRTGAGAFGSDPPLSGYQPAARPRSMKVLRPTKASSSTSSSARTGAAYEPAPGLRSTGERDGRKQAVQPAVSSWNISKRSMSGPVLGGSFAESKTTATANHQVGKVTTTSTSVPPSVSNPLGGASAFSFLKPKTPAGTAD
ncbi:hypothetical protein QBC38DRAFT_186335 [Podospora fimiseda]|uniref:Ubiquitin carboxyl-terminal hydrolase 19 n=1 Tax=Podospora fimiseda TaxID=252190 RepID=A0AAN7H329_9PEZI|nr:hypothetical protein QBC38DRAFT_186335 [Podospora fimiseda]